MSGIFGIVDPRRKIDVRPLVNKMVVAMSHREWFVTDHFVDDERNLALGRIGIGIFNKAPQPVWNVSCTVALVMAGEFYNHEALGWTGKDKADSDEHIALTLYEQFGNDFVSRLNGAFIISIWDKVRNRLLIANDRFGLYPLFYTHHAGRLIFAPEVKGILCDETFPRKLDLTALAQYMRFQHLLGNRTFFEDITLLPNASILVYDFSTAACKVKPYWSFADIPDNPHISFNEAVIEAGRLLRRVVQHLSNDAYRPGVYLSGGCDSRTILGLVDRRPVASITYGAQNCRDVYYAHQIARVVDSNHHWFDLPNGEWVKEYANFHLALTEGFHSWIHAHGISTLPKARQLMDVNLTGWDGGLVMSSLESTNIIHFTMDDDTALSARLFHLFNQKYTWPGITEAEECLLYEAPVRQKIQGLAFDSFRTELSSYLNYRPDVRIDYFFLRNHCSRLTQNFITFTRSYIEVRFPYFDYDLFDFVFSIPSPLRAYDCRLYRTVIQREIPRLAYIPYDKDEVFLTPQPLVRNAHTLTVKLKRRFNQHLWPIFPERDTLYADYENYLRNELRGWAEDILFDERTLGRGIFRPEALRSLMNRHLAGCEQWTIGKIAPIITFEMMLRAIYDK